MNTFRKPPSQSKAVRVAEELRKRLETNATPPSAAAWASRRVAAEFGVAIGTANRALRMLAAEGLLERRPRTGTRVAGDNPIPRIACLLDTDFNGNMRDSWSDMHLHYLLLLEELKHSRCEFQVISFADLQKRFFSPHILDGFDGLLVENAFSDAHSRQLIGEFTRPKVWTRLNFPLLESGDQVMVDHTAGMMSLLRKARQEGIRYWRFHFANSAFKELFQTAAIAAGVTESACEYDDFTVPATQLAWYKFGLNLEFARDIFHLCDSDVGAAGLFEAFVDRGGRPGDFAVAGHGNIEAAGILPLGVPRLTTLAYDRQTRARISVTLLLERIKHDDRTSTSVKIPTVPVYRESAFGKCGCIAVADSISNPKKEF